MSDIDIQIENNKGSIKELKQKREDLNRQIGVIKERFKKKSISLTDAMKQIQLKKEQIKIYNSNISMFEDLNKKLKGAKSKKEDLRYQNLTPEQQNLTEESEPIPNISSSKPRRITHPNQFNPRKNTTKKKLPTPVQELLEDVEINDEYFSNPKEEQKSSKSSEYTGFRETLKEPVKKEFVKLDENICKNIFENGSKVNKAHFFPSEFPKLTRIKPITLSNKKGGKRKSRKNVKK